MNAFSSPSLHAAGGEIVQATVGMLFYNFNGEPHTLNKMQGECQHVNRGLFFIREVNT